jgi:hypothetical protein
MIEFICFRDEMHILEAPKVIVVAFFAVNARILRQRGAQEIAVPGGGQARFNHAEPRFSRIVSPPEGTSDAADILGKRMSVTR